MSGMPEKIPEKLKDPQKSVRRIIRKAQFGLHIHLHERTYHRTTYYFLRNRESDVLTIGFSGIQQDKKAKYNYIETQQKESTNKLAILDDVYTPGGIGSFYLGQGGEWYFLEDIPAIVSKIVKKYGIKKIITFGSSKGGYAAVLYGIKLGADACIVGSPCYHAGEYLAHGKNLRFMMQTIMGDTSQASIDKLNVVLEKTVKTAEKKPTVYVHYSPLDHMYKEHGADLIADLKEHGFTVYEDHDYQYESHLEVRKYFKKYLSETLHMLVKQG